MDYDTEKMLKKPYLIIGEAAGFKVDAVKSILKDEPVVQVKHIKKHDEFFIYFDSIADLEDSFRKLEKLKYNFSMEMVRSNALAEEPNEELEKEPEEEPKVELKEEYQNQSTEEPSTDVQINLREFIVSKINSLPKLTRKPLVPFIKYFEDGSLIKIHDPIRRYFHACDEHVLERYGIFKMALTTKQNYAFEFRNGRLIKRYIDAKDMQNLKSVQTDEECAKIMLENGYIPCCCCGQLCMSSCSKCSTPFCGDICAIKMQKEHEVACPEKHILIYKQPKVIVKEVKNRFLDDQMPVSGSKVQVTAFQQSNVICVRSLGEHEDDMYHGILDEVQKGGKSAKKFTGQLKCGQLVLLKLDKEFLRAMVLNAENQNAISLICVDYGNLEIQPMDNLYEISKYLAALARYVVPVQLQDVPHRFMHANYRKMLYYLLNQSKVLIKYDQKSFDYDSKLFLLFVDKLDDAVNKRLAELCAAVVPKTKCNFYDMLPEVSISIGTAKKLFVMDNSLIDKGAICCTLPEFTHEIKKFQKDFKAYVESTPAACYTPRVDELCIAKYLNVWCRGRCLEIVGDGFPTVLFLDYGNVAHISCENIRPYPDVFVGYPLLSFDVELIDLPKNCDDNLIKKLQNELPTGEIITCDLSYDKKDKFYFMEMPKIN